MIKHLSISGYRTLAHLYMKLDPVNIFHGANGVGKTNLYNALRVIHAAAMGNVSYFLAREGGMQSVLTDAAFRASGPAQMAFSVGIDEEYEYSFCAGLVAQAVIGGEKVVMGDGFEYEPQIKTEALVFREGQRTWKLFSRKNQAVRALDENMAVHDLSSVFHLSSSSTVLSELSEPKLFPEIMAVRKTLCSWRFYHGFRVDACSAIRQPCLAVSSYLLDSSGRNLAAVLATLKYIVGDIEAVERAVGLAFEGAQLVIPKPGRTASFGLQYKGVSSRVYEALELSDGTLQFLCLAVALNSPRPPAFIALNEPENSLHPELMEALAEMIAGAARHSQLWVVTHSEWLAEAVQARTDAVPRCVVKVNGVTKIQGLRADGEVGL